MSNLESASRLYEILELVQEKELYVYEAEEKILELFNYDEEGSRGRCCKCGEQCDYC